MTEFWHDPVTDTLVYPAANAPIAALPEAKVINNGHASWFAVPRTLRTSQVLRFWNYPVPPIMSDYDWPAAPGLVPYATQKLRSNFLVLHPRCFDLSDMGTGKTLSALWAADWLMRQHDPGTFRCLIVAPLSILQRVWADAIFKNFLNRRTFQILHGEADRRVKNLAKPADFYIINTDGVGVGAQTRRKFELDGLSKALQERTDIRLAIIDEASGYRDASTKRHRIARLVIGGRDYLWMLTGTPTPNAPTDAYGLAKLVNNAYSKSFTSFQLETMTKVSLYKWVAKKDGYEQARKLLQPAIRIDIKEVWDAPECTTQQREVPLTSAQKEIYNKLKRDLLVHVKTGTISVANEGAMRTKFMQIAQGAVYDNNHNEHYLDCEPRLAEARAIIQSTDRKVVCFVALTSVLNMLYKHMTEHWAKQNLPWKAEILNGPVPLKRRSEIIQEFERDPQLKVLFVDPGTTAHGINEFALVADTALWFGPIDKNELYIQGNKRINRPGQKYPMTIVQLVSTPLEREIFRRLETNTSMQGALLDMVQRGEL